MDEASNAADTTGNVVVRETGRGRFQQEVVFGPHRLIVPAELQVPEQKPEPPKAKHAAAPARKKKTQMVARRRPPEPAMQTFAWGPPAFQAPFGGY